MCRLAKLAMARWPTGATSCAPRTSSPTTTSSGCRTSSQATAVRRWRRRRLTSMMDAGRAERSGRRHRHGPHHRRDLRRMRSSAISRAPRITTATWTSRSPAPRRHHRPADGHRVTGITSEIMREALEQARAGRVHILGNGRDAGHAAHECLVGSRSRIVTIKIPAGQIRDVIGPGGKMIRRSSSARASSIDVEYDVPGQRRVGR